MKETRGRSLTRQVHQRLQERVREAGPRAERRIEEALGRRPGWLRDRRRTGAIELGLLLDALDYLDEDPRRFFRLALGEDEERYEARQLGEPPPIVRMVHALGTAKPQGKPLSLEEIEALDRLRYYYPDRVLHLAEAAVPRTPRALLPQLLGVAASAYRVALDPDQAEHTIAAAVEVARVNRDQQTRCNLLQRLSYIEGVRGNYIEALQLAERATGTYIHLRDLAHVGTSLVDQGLWLLLLNRFREAVAAFEAALEYLPDSLKWNRLAAFQNLGTAYRAIGEPKTALAYILRSEEMLPDLKFDPWPTGRAQWALALISTDLGKLAEAEQHFIRMADIYRSVHSGETAFATVALVRVKLLQAKPREAYEAAKSMLCLLEPLRHNHVISSAIAELVRAGITGLSLELVEHVKATFEVARMRPSWWPVRKA